VILKARHFVQVEPEVVVVEGASSTIVVGWKQQGKYLVELVKSTGVEVVFASEAELEEFVENSLVELDLWFTLEVVLLNWILQEFHLGSGIAWVIDWLLTFQLDIWIQSGN
jgi:hypothetical protein